MAVDMKRHIIGNEKHPDYKFQESPLGSPWLGNVDRSSAKTPKDSNLSLDELRDKMKLSSGRLNDSDFETIKKLLKDTDVQVDADELILQEYNRIQEEIDRNYRMTEQLRRAIRMQNEDYPNIEPRQLDDKPSITIPSGN